MSTWNYRILSDGLAWWVARVSYGPDNEPEGFDAVPALAGEELGHLVSTLELAADAARRPVLLLDAAGGLVAEGPVPGPAVAPPEVEPAFHEVDP